MALTGSQKTVLALLAENDVNGEVLFDCDSDEALKQHLSKYCGIKSGGLLAIIASRVKTAKGEMHIHTRHFLTSIRNPFVLHYSGPGSRFGGRTCLSLTECS